MSEIALYNVLTKMGATPEEAEKAIADIASSKDTVTKADLRAAIAELKAEMLKQQLVVAVLIIAAVGLMIKFL